MPSSPSNRPFINVDTTSAERSLPSWVMPTISALGMLVVCLICFLGYIVMDKGSRPDTPISIAQKPEPKNEQIVEPEPIAVQKEEPVTIPNKQDALQSDEPMPEVVIEENPVLPESKSEEDSDFSISPILPEQPLQKDVQAEQVRWTPEPVEVTEARQQFEESVEQTIQPYREDLEKELTIAKKNGVLNLVLALEAELKHLASDECTKITPFNPEKRVLFNAKVRFKKKIETALENYQKKLNDIVKELVRTERIDEAKIAQEISDHSGNVKIVPSTPKRHHTQIVPVRRLTLELDSDGQGRFTVKRGTSSEQPPDNFRGTLFPLSAFPKTQAYRGENGMGRVVFDFRNADSMETWHESGWEWYERHSHVDLERKSWCFTKVDLNWPVFGIRIGKLPCRTMLEVTDRSNAGPQLQFHLLNRVGTSLVTLWHDIKDGKISVGGFYVQAGKDKTEDNRIGLQARPIVNDFEKLVQVSFQLPKEILADIEKVVFDCPVGFTGSTEKNVDMILLDISGKIDATTGMNVRDCDGKALINEISPKMAAFRAGLKEGDVIIRFNGEKRSAEQIQKILDNVRFGDLITIAAARDGEEKAFRFHAE